MSQHIVRQTIAFVAGGIAVVALAIGGTTLAIGTDEAPEVTAVVHEPDPTPMSEADLARGPVTYLVECVEGNFVQKPASFQLACADAGMQLDSLAWENWGADVATATGDVLINGGENAERLAVHVVADKIVNGEASATYGELLVTFDGAPPAGFEQVETFKLPTVEAMPNQSDN